MPTIPPFSGQETISANVERVYSVLTNPDLLKDCIPDAVSTEKTGPHAMKGVVRPGLSFLRGTLKFVLDVTPGATDAAGSRSVSLKALSEGIGAKVGVESSMKIHPDGAGSKVDWTAQVTELKGLVAAAPAGLIKAAADKAIRDAWDRVRTKAETV